MSSLRDHDVYKMMPVGAPYIMGRWHRDVFSHQGFVWELKALLKPRHRIEGKKKFLIFGRARSGTTLLTNLLNQVDGVRCSREFLHFRVCRPAAFLKRIAEQSREQAFGCKLLSYQVVEVQRMRDPKAFFRELVEDGFELIHIRRDTLSQCLSLSLAQKRDFYHADGKQRIPTGKLLLDTDQFVAQVRWNEALLDFEKQVLADFNPFVVDYGRDLQDPMRHQHAVDNVCQYIDMPSNTVKAGLQKVGGESYANIVSNYDELLEKVARAGYDRLLEA